MADLASISAILGSVKTATEIAKFLKDSDLTIEKAEFKLQLAELISNLADMKMETAEIQSLLIEKDNDIAELKDQLKTKGMLKYETPFYFIIDEELKDGPFCQNCQDDRNKLIRLQLSSDKYWMCKACNSGFDEEPNAPLSPLYT